MQAERTRSSAEHLERMWSAQPQREVDVTLLREAFLASGRSLADVARALDWYDRAHADGGRVSRTLGLRPVRESRGPRRGLPVLRRWCSYDTAVRMAHAIGVDPVELGL